MKKQSILAAELKEGVLDARLTAIYGCKKAGLPHKRERLLALMDTFEKTYGAEREVGLYSAPGRTEMGGNHTDHQHGRVLAAAIDLDAIACASKSGSMTARVLSEGYPEIVVDLSVQEPQKEEEGTTAALIRGVAAKIHEMGYPVCGFDACVTSEVLSGSGLSSSAAFEVLIGVIINDMFCEGALTQVQLAQIGQYAENVFFGKPCGLMDQLASAVGGIVSIDFEDPAKPIVNRLDYDLSSSGHALCIIDSGADHADLTDEYAAIPNEMKQVAAFFGKEYLREIEFEEFWANIAKIRKQTGDRAVLRAFHFYTDNLLALKQAQALEKEDFYVFLTLVQHSGKSSAEHLQNLYCSSQPEAQAVVLTIAAARRLLEGKGAVRVHGGGFAGTVQAYVPFDMTEEFRQGMESILGEGCCHFLSVRPGGGVVIG
ncbi:MAG: galactokinase [Butyricicoccus pullicaecorum]|nr:galactokinase [Butyricicoccus pullicaecorum]